MTRNRSVGLSASAAALTLALSVAACGGSDDNNATAATPASTTVSPTTASPTTASPTGSSASATVDTTSAGGLGTILVDSQGDTLYVFDKDTGTQSTCSGACAQSWPPLRASGKPTAGAGATASMLGTTPRSDGKPQVTYNGHPLYTFTADQGPGQTNGQGVTAFGAPWYVISPSGDQITTQGSTSTSSSAPAY
jgi:predicted lipoprotein with Yx(FWY)xxD motif